MKRDRALEPTPERQLQHAVELREAEEQDAGQQQTAYAILRELQDEAKRYRERYKDEFAELEARFKEIYQSNPKTGDVRKAQEQLKPIKAREDKLLKPIKELSYDRNSTVSGGRQRYVESQGRVRLKAKINGLHVAQAG